MKKTVLYIRSDIMHEPLIAGGSVTHTIGVIQALIKQGVSLMCAASCMQEQLAECTGMHQQISLRMPASLKFLRWKLNSFLSTFFFAWRIARNTQLCTVTHLYQRYSILNCTGVLLAWWYKKPFTLEYNGSELWINTHWARTQLLQLNWLIRAIEYINLRFATHIIVVSQALADELCARGIATHKIAIIPNGVDVHQMASSALVAERSAIRHQLAIENTFVLGFIGTFSQWHGIPIIAALIERVARDQLPIHFMCIGDGPLLSMLRMQINACSAEQLVTLTGLLPEPRARAYLAACDAFIAPNQSNTDGSRFFGSPTKLFAYMSMGKPIIASKLEQLAQLISPALELDDSLKLHGNYNTAVGIVVEPAATEQFYASLCALQKMNESTRVAMGQRARALAVNHYSWDCHVRRIVKMWDTQHR
ncbi:MAG: glycosyltransferase family 4 protein [Candidatus Babeliales bacterium]